MQYYSKALIKNAVDFFMACRENSKILFIIITRKLGFNFKVTTSLISQFVTYFLGLVLFLTLLALIKFL